MSGIMPDQHIKICIMRNIHCFKLTLSLISFLLSGPAISQTVFANDYAGNIYVIRDCIPTQLCTSTLFSDIAWQGGVLYGTAGMKIYTIDTATGISTQIATGTQGISYTGMAGDGSGNLYLCDFSGVLYRYQIATGLFLTVGNTGTGCNGDIAFTGDTIYMTGTGNTLVRITLNPFSSNVVGTMSFAGSAGNSYGLVPGPVSNILYASVWFNGYNKLFIVNKSDASTMLLCDSLAMITNNIFGLASDLEDIGTGITMAEKRSGFLLYPIPAGNQLFIQPPESIDGEYAIQIFNMQGVRIFEDKIGDSGPYILGLSGFSNGIYIFSGSSLLGTDSFRFTVCR